MQSNSDDQKLEDLHPPGERRPQAPLACPDCSGSLWLTGAEPAVRYQCHVGHQFSEQGLASAKEDELELALWTALRVLKENAALHGTMAERARAGGRTASAEQFERRMRELHDKAQIIHKAIATVPMDISTTY
jgi:two-component system, chemotaxis family, protein-glutamate methylesterase/glutaminase